MEENNTLGPSFVGSYSERGVADTGPTSPRGSARAICCDEDGRMEGREKGGVLARGPGEKGYIGLERSA